MAKKSELKTTQQNTKTERTPAPVAATPRLPVRHIVCDGRSVMLKDRSMIKERQFVPNGAFDAGELADLCRGGSVREIKPYHDPRDEQAEQVAVIKPFRHTGKWDFDPEEIANDSLEDLNIKILERDENATPYETREEAIAKLSSDFQG